MAPEGAIALRFKHPFHTSKRLSYRIWKPTKPRQKAGSYMDGIPAYALVEPVDIASLA
jgi:hypothetical protein